MPHLIQQAVTFSNAKGHRFVFNWKSISYTLASDKLQVFTISLVVSIFVKHHNNIFTIT